jgi:predicted HD phosphohydrolase
LKRSPACSRRSARDEDAESFLTQPFAAEAVRLRRYDDAAKVPGKTTPVLAHFMDLARSLAGR